MKHSFSIELDHIILRPMNEEENELYRQLRNREDNRMFFFHSAVIQYDTQRNWFKSYLEKPGEYMFSIYLKKSNKFIGGVGIYDIDHKMRTAEVGRIIVDREFAAGKGYGTETLRGIEKLALNALGLRTLYANIYISNIASLKTFLKAGYIKTVESQDTVKVELTL